MSNLSHKVPKEWIQMNYKLESMWKNVPIVKFLTHNEFSFYSVDGTAHPLKSGYHGAQSPPFFIQVILHFFDFGQFNTMCSTYSLPQHKQQFPVSMPVTILHIL